MTQHTFSIGDGVRLKGQRDQIGIIRSTPTILNGVAWYKVFFSANNVRNVPESSLEKCSGDRDVESLFKEGSFGNKESFACNLSYIKLKQPLKDYLYSFLASRTEFYPYQFKPLVKFLASSNQRLLIADEVGLGKTIEAGLILSELRSRVGAERVLVVCPSSLKKKWYEELRRRFDEEFEIMDSGRFRTFLSKYVETGGFERLRGICSLQMLRAAGIQEALKEAGVSFDVVIVDEAHHMRNTDTLSYQLGGILGEEADAMIFLTATPIQLGNENLFNLLRLLDDEEFDNLGLFTQKLRVNENIIKSQKILEAGFPADFKTCKSLLRNVESTAEKEKFLKDPIYHETLRKLDAYSPSQRDHIIDIQQDISSLNLLSHIFTRSRKKEVMPDRAVRVSRVIPVVFTPEEKNFYDKVTDYVRSQAGNSAFAGFIAMMPQRQMASCIPAMIRHYRDAFSKELRENLDEQIDVDPEDYTNTGEESETFSPLKDKQLMALINEAKATSEVDSKFKQFVEALRKLDEEEPDRKIVVFSYFKKTHYYLAERLKKEGYKTEIINGDVPSRPNDPDRDERAKRIERFKDPESAVRILISSEVGSEGIDLQFCHILFNYDLPWNPMKVEQRIGRLDRINQKSDRILIFNFAVKETIEELMLNRLYTRIKIFEESIGDLEAILGEEIRELTKDLLSSKLTPAEREARIEQTARAIERKKIDQDRLERQASQFVGHDAFFDEEIKRIREQKRYLTPEEIYVFVTDFLKKHFPRAELRKMAGLEDGYELTVPEDLYQFVREKTRESDPLLGQFLARASRERVFITFRSDTAYQRPDLEYLYLHHPLVRAIVSHYEKNEADLNGVSKVELVSDVLEKGDYAYFIYLVETKALKSGFKLESIIINCDSGKSFMKEESMKVVALMVEQGTQYAEEPLWTTEQRDRLFQTAEGLMASCVEVTSVDLARVNEAMINRKRENVRQSYDRKIEKREAELKEGEQKGWQERRLNMSRGSIRNLKSKRDLKIRDLEESLNISITSRLVAAGFLRISSP